MKDLRKLVKKIIHNLRHFFIPHAHNDYKPHIFREISVSIIIGAILFLFGFSIASAYIIQGTEIGREIVSKVLVDLTNESRKSYNLPILTPNLKLYNASLLKAKDMANGQYFAHESPSGAAPWDFIERVGYEYSYAGENLAINHTENQKTKDAWMSSPLHRRNILDPKFEEIGISAYSSLYENKNTIFVVQMFASPALYQAKEDNIIVKKEISKVLKKEEVLAKIPEEKIVLINENTVKEIKTEDLREEIYDQKNTVNKTKVLGDKNVNYSNVYERFIYSGSSYVQNVLQILFITIFIATLFLIFIEIKRQHPNHIAYAIFLIIILVTLMYLNKNYLEFNLVFLK